MAQTVGFFEDYPERGNPNVYSEGPFVVCILPFNGYRIEVQMDDHKCPVHTHHSVYEIEKGMKGPGNTTDYSKAVRVCDALNQMVKEGKIVKNSVGLWIAIDCI